MESQCTRIKMALLKYFTKERKESSTPFPTRIASLTRPQIQRVNSRVKRSLEERQQSERGKYNEYTTEERACIGKFVADNGPAKAVRRFSDRKLPESTARRFKLEYLSALKAILLKSLHCPQKLKGDLCFLVNSWTI